MQQTKNMQTNASQTGHSAKPWPSFDMYRGSLRCANFQSIRPPWREPLCCHWPGPSCPTTARWQHLGQARRQGPRWKKTSVAANISAPDPDSAPDPRDGRHRDLEQILGPRGPQTHTRSRSRPSPDPLGVRALSGSDAGFFVASLTYDQQATPVLQIEVTIQLHFAQGCSV